MSKLSDELRERYKEGSPTRRIDIKDLLDEHERMEADLSAYRAAIPGLERAQVLGEADRLGQVEVLPVSLGIHLWQWDGEEIREWHVDMIQILHGGGSYIGCVDVVEGMLGDDYEQFDMCCVGHKLKFTEAEAREAAGRDETT